MNVILIAMIVLFALSAIYGYRRGILGMLFAVITWALIFGGVPYARPYIETYMRENETISESIEDAVSKYIDGKMERARESLMESGDYVAPAEGAFGKLGEEISEKVGEFLQKEEEKTREILVDESLDVVYHTLSYIVAIIGILLVIGILSLIVRSINYVPVIGKASRTLGLFLGIINAFVITWVLFYILYCLQDTDTGTELLAMVHEQPVVEAIYEKNPIMYLLR